ncbi:hypothetical protein K437DRAFT_254735 [Tilletiaria anomala UBC 951]|uniref:Uncharacterized protein n=1 Tax=Tilletiaria anomala (strain ATCC 24038 / CBS 436.72 / UBC 951) TaxID=1037660 RepID=A0A066WE15_TILAU|nr:uncharacterized protein K437DRAFT_254735 [Tilletiaria anomala UBC 951]KDN51996.1 hypothetical protein K437DRAFT_254735 [Tilletiaria anomala UBC 951]
MIARSFCSLRAAVLACLCLCLLSAQGHAQYFSQGWSPGQPRQPPQHDKQQAAAAYGSNLGWSPNGWKRVPNTSGAKVARNESVIDSLIRSGLTTFLRWSDDDVDVARAYRDAQKNPTFHPRVEVLSTPETPDIADILGFGPPVADEDESVFTEVKHAVVNALPERIGGTRAEPWAILISASRQDKESQNQDVVFNRTIHALFPDASLGLPQIVQPPSASGEDDKGDEDVAEGYEIVGGFIVPIEDSTKDEAQRAARKARKQKKQKEEQLEQLEGVEVLSATQAAKREKLAEFVRPALDSWRFGYIDFFNNTDDIGWQWFLWKVPVMVIATPSTSPERLYDLRFWKLAFAKPRPDDMLSFLGNPGQWQALPVWDSSLAPGGKRHVILLRMAAFFKKYIYPFFEVVPGWAITLVIGGAASIVPSLLHSEDDKKLKAAHEAKKRGKAAEEAVKQSMSRASASASSTTSKVASVADAADDPTANAIAPDTSAAGTRSRVRKSRN